MTQKRVIIQGKWEIGVWVIEVLLYIKAQLFKALLA